MRHSRFGSGRFGSLLQARLAVWLTACCSCPTKQSPAGRFWVLHGSPAGVDKASSCFDAQSVSAQNSKPIASAVSSNRCKRYLIGKHIPFSSSPLRRSNEQLPDFYQDELRVKVLTRILRSRFGPMTTTKKQRVNWPISTLLSTNILSALLV